MRASLLLPMFLLGCASGPAPVVINIPAVVMGRIGGPTRVMATVSGLREPFDCPAVTWVWGDGSYSRQESDAIEGEPCPASYTAEHYYYGRGEFLVLLHLKRDSHSMLLRRHLVIK